jgi:hypothetical protein
VTEPLLERTRAVPALNALLAEQRRSLPTTAFVVTVEQHEV